MSAVAVLPPSPPATSSGSRKRSLPLFASHPATSTPDDSPASGPDSSSLGSRKRVEFSNDASIHHPSAQDESAVDTSSVKLLLPSRDCQSSIKSILKSTFQHESQTVGFDGPADDKLSLNEIMESIVEQLSKNDNTESIDAYQILASTIKAYDEIPDEAVLRNKLNSIIKQIRHHLYALDRQDTQPTDVNLVTSALKVLVILVWKPEFESLMTDDFRSFMLDRAVGVITKHTAPKSVIIHYLHLLATQNFSPGLLNSRGRASRLVESLKNLSDHVKGNGITSERLIVYQRLLDQARPVMKSKSSLWVEHMLTAMGSTISDTRNKALALGRKACQVFPPSNSISGSVRFALDLKQESGRTLGSSLCRRLEKLAIGKEQATQVPQIWAVILLLCNNSSMQIDNWKGLKDFLAVIQRCFNASETDLRLQANIAWNRFVYIARPHEASENLLPMLARPVIAQLDRTATEKSSKASHSAAMSSYCNLLYYAFRPAASNLQYSKAWDEYIVKIMRSSFFEKSSGNADMASRILMSLLWNAKTNTKVWNENRAHENRQVEPEELPTIDYKWTRSRCLPVLKIFQVLFRHSSWGLPGHSDQAYVSKAWRHLMKAIREAGSKEIKMSNETRNATTDIVKFLTTLWRHEEGFSDVDEANGVRSSKEILINISNAAVSEIGLHTTMDVLEASLDVSSTPLLVVIFDRLKLELSGPSNTTTLLTKYFKLLLQVVDFQYEAAPKTIYAENASFLKSLSDIISSAPTAIIEHGLEILGPGLGRWLRDTEGYLSFDKSSERDLSTDRLPGEMRGFVDAFVKALASVSPAYVSILDECLAAAFASSHSTMVNAIVQLWNDKFGDKEELVIGPQVTEAIKNLSPFVEIKVPAIWKRNENGSAPPTPSYETQFQRALPTAAEVQAESRQGDVLPDEPIDLGDQAEETMYDFDEERSAAAIARRRHDDSQLDFVAIDSSPPQATAAESQYLTDRQKEVRDRQREEAMVTFPDLRSSTRPQSRHSEPRDCGFARKAATMHERPTTPILAEQNDNDADPGPSPTPRSRLVREVSEVDVPSSPVSIQGLADGEDGNEENVSSPIAEAVEAQDGQVQLRSPHKLALTTLQPPMTELIPEAPQSPEAEADDDDGQVLESPQTAMYPSNGTDSNDQTKDENMEEKAVATKQGASNMVQGPVPVVAEVELPSSPPTECRELKTTPPRQSSSVFNTDELEELSASQLSHDLDWSVLEGLATPSTASKSPWPSNGIRRGSEMKVEAETRPAFALPQAEEDQVDEQTTETAHIASEKPQAKKRKRAQSGYAEPKKRRRKSNRSHSQSSSSQGSNFKQEDEGVLDDCIVVHTSSEYLGSSSPVRPTDEQPDAYILSQPDFTATNDQLVSQHPYEQSSPVESGHLSVVGGLRRRPGRPRKSDIRVKLEAAESMQDLSAIVEQSSVDRNRGPSQSRSRSRHRMSVEVSAEPEPSPVRGTRQALVPVVEITAPTSDALQSFDGEDKPLEAAIAASDADPAPPQLDVVGNLQAILDQLRSRSGDPVDVRAIDELCFQIRYQAQVNAMRDSV